MLALVDLPTRDWLDYHVEPTLTLRKSAATQDMIDELQYSTLQRRTVVMALLYSWNAFHMPVELPLRVMGLWHVWRVVANRCVDSYLSDFCFWQDLQDAYARLTSNSIFIC